MGTQDEATGRADGESGDRLAELVRHTAGVRVLPASLTASQGPSGPPLAERDGLIAELRRLLEEPEEPADPDGPAPPDRSPAAPALHATALARLGALLGDRWTRSGEEAERTEAMALLRRARTGDLLAPEDRTDAARDLGVLLVGRYAERRPLGMDAIDDMLKAAVPAVNGGPGYLETVAELEELAHEVAATKRGGMPPALARLLAFQTECQAALVSGDAARLQRAVAGSEDLDLSLLGPMGPVFDQLRRMLTGPGVQRPESIEPPTLDDQLELRTMMGLMTETAQPGALTAEQLSELLRQGQAAEPGTVPHVSDPMQAMTRMMLGGRTGDPAQYEEALRLLRKTVEEGQQGEEFPWFVRGVLPGILTGTAMSGGNLLDQAVAEQLVAQSLAPGDGPLITQQPTGRPGAVALLRANRCLLLMSRLTQAADAEDVPALEEVIESALDLLDEIEEADGAVRQDGTPGSGAAEGPGPDDAASRSMLAYQSLFLLAAAHLAIAKCTGAVAPLRTAQHYVDQAYERAPEVSFERGLMDSMVAPLLALTSQLDPDPDRLAGALARARATLDGNPVFTDQRIRTRLGIAMALSLRHDAEGDPALLDQAIEELELTRAELPAGTVQATSSVHWELADTRAKRAGHDGADLVQAVADARESLRATAADVLLQEGVQHGLEVARGGARRGLRAAGWAVRAGRPEEAVACLEAGRALVLGAAAVSATVPERLAALGEAELARQWREARPGAAGAPPEGLLTALLDGSSQRPELPSGLRRRVLDLLAGRGAGLDGRLPEASELSDAVAGTGSDALVYLLPGEGDEDGWALVVAPDRSPWALPLPALSEPGRAPVAGYLEAGRVRFCARRGEERWEAALEALCEWAGEGVVGPLLSGLGLWERGLLGAGLLPGRAGEPGPAPVRLTVVACGNLGVVPWQAARLPVPPHWTAAGAPAALRACEAAVLTYAASGRELLRAAGTRRLPLSHGQALVCVPADLDMAEDEVLAVRDAYYPGAALFGEFDTLDLDPAPPGGTPEEVLGLLGARAAGSGPAAVVHLVCHGTAGADPASSVLELGRPAGGGPEAGRLSVTRLLDAPAGPARAGRPLVVLSACETDLSTRDHDEALTVTTAFVHGLAADAVGSRWKVRDDASAVLMTVFHHHVAAGLAPPDALRAAQRWMLAPAGERPAVAGLTPHLRRTADRPELTGTAFWGAFIHQGNPAPLSAADRAGSRYDLTRDHRPHRTEGEPTA